jgi:hypothetical protein
LPTEIKQAHYSVSFILITTKNTKNKNRKDSYLRTLIDNSKKIGEIRQNLKNNLYRRSLFSSSFILWIGSRETQLYSFIVSRCCKIYERNSVFLARRPGKEAAVVYPSMGEIFVLILVCFCSFFPPNPSPKEALATARTVTIEQTSKTPREKPVYLSRGVRERGL